MFVLEEIYKSKQAENSDQFNLRIHRGLSWFKKAILLNDDLDLQLISLWISFKAIYAQDVQNIDFVQDDNTFRGFLSEILQSDQEHKIDQLIWGKFSQPITRMIDSPYVLQSFWDYQNQKISQTAWRDAFEKKKNNVYQAIQSKDTFSLLWIIFNRLDVAQNQILKGGATYNSVLNREQLQDICSVFSAILSAFIYILLENPNIFNLTKPFYPMQQMS